jgi:hypothetical protein
VDPVVESLVAFAEPPEWLSAAGDGERVSAALRREVPELAGPISLQACHVEDLRLRGSQWTGRYVVSLGSPSGELTHVALTGVVDPRDQGRDERPGRLPFDDPDWRIRLEDPPVALRHAEVDRRLAALPLLTQPSTAAGFLESALASVWPGIHVDACDPYVVRYRAGQRCALVCHLDYSEEADPAWPGVVVAKVHRRGEGAIGHAALQALAASGVGRSGHLRLAEPLGYLPEHDVSIQSFLPQDRSLSELVERAASGSVAAATEAASAVRVVAGALVELHDAPVRHGSAYTIDREIAAARAGADKLAAVFPSLRGVVEPLLSLVEQRAATAADPTRPSHGAFRPAQVRLDGDCAGMLDLDGFGSSEPGQDVGRFVGKLRLLVMRARSDVPLDSSARSQIADRLAGKFLDQYADQAAVSADRVALWEILDLLKALLQSWSRVRPAQIQPLLVLLEARVGELRDNSGRN